MKARRRRVSRGRGWEGSRRSAGCRSARYGPGRWRRVSLAGPLCVAPLGPLSVSGSSQFGPESQTYERRCRGFVCRAAQPLRAVTAGAVSSPIFRIVRESAWRGRPNPAVRDAFIIIIKVSVIGSTRDCLQRDRLHLGPHKPTSFVVLTRAEPGSNSLERNPDPVSWSFTSLTFREQRYQIYVTVKVKF